jgi:hypothetical protein
VTGFRDLLHRLEKVAAGVCHASQARRVEPTAILKLILRVDRRAIPRRLSGVGKDAKKLVRKTLASPPRAGYKRGAAGAARAVLTSAGERVDVHVVR